MDLVFRALKMVVYGSKFGDDSVVAQEKTLCC